MLQSWAGYAPRAVAATIGLLAVSLASLTYEDEEGHFQSRLENGWIRLDEAKKASLSWTASFIKVVAELTSRCIDRVFGKRLLSPRAVAVSIVLSAASCALTGSIVSILPIAILAKNHNPTNAITFFVLFLRILAFALVPGLSEIVPLPWRPWHPRIIRAVWWVSLTSTALVAASFLLHVYASTPNGHKYGVLFTGVLLLGLAFGVLCDLSYIAFMRWILRRIANADQISRIVLAMTLMVLAAVMIVVLPFYFGIRLAPYSEPLGIALILSYTVNSLDVAALLVVLALATLMLAHRLMWPLLQRPLYAIQRAPLIKQRGWMWAIGIFFITYASTGVPEWVRKLVDRIIQ